MRQEVIGPQVPPLWAERKTGDVMLWLPWHWAAQGGLNKLVRLGDSTGDCMRAGGGPGSRDPLAQGRPQPTRAAAGASGALETMSGSGTELLGGLGQVT